MKTALKTSISAICAALVAFISSSALHAQTTGPLYWNIDNDNGTTFIDATNAVSTDQAGNNPTTYNLNGTDVPDFYFSSDKVGTEAQTIGLETDSAFQFNTLNFLKGSITLSGDAGLFLGQGLTVGSGAGPTAISLAGSADNLGTVNSITYYSDTIYYQTNTWNNNSANALTITGNVASFSGTETLTFNGTGTGAINISGSVSGKIDQESATSAVSMGNRNGITSLNLGNGGKVYFTTSDNYNTTTTSTTGGELNFAGDTVLANGGSVVFNATSLTFGTGDALDVSAVAQNIGTLNLDGSSTTTFNRLIVGINGSASGLNLLANTTTLNVSNNYILDFGTGNNGGAGYTFNGQLNFASGSALEARNNSLETFTNVVLPTGSGNWTVGNDDVGSNDTFNITNAQTLTGTLLIHLKGGGVTTNLNGAIGGSGGLTFDGASAPNFDYSGEGALWLNGTNTYSGATVLQYALGTHNYPVVVINGDSSGIGNEIDVKAGNLVLASGAKIPTGSIISLGDPNGAQNSDNLTLQIGTNGGANVTVYNVQAVSPWNNPNDRGGDSIVGSGSTVSNLTWDVESGLDTFQGHIGGSNSNLALIKTGAGQLYLTSGNNTFNGGTTINAGTLSILSGQNFGAGDAALGVGTVTINNAATLNVIGTNGFLNQIVLGTKGTVTSASGDTYQVAAQITANNTSGGGIDSFYQDPNASLNNGQAGVVGGNGIAITGGDVLVSETVASTPGEVDILSGRLLMFGNNDFIANATKVVTAGGVLDFGAGGNQTVTAPIYFSDGGAINTRGTNTTINLQPLVGSSGKMPTLTIGTDDVGGGSISVSNNVVLSSNIEIIGQERDNSFTGVYFNGGFSGTGNITIDTAGIVPNFISFNRGIIVVSGTNTYQGDTTVQGGVFDLTGNNTGVTSAGGGAPNYYVVASSKPYIDGNNNPQNYYTPGILQVGAGGSLASNAKVVVGGSNGFAYFVLGDGNGAANATISSLTLSDSSAGANGSDNGAVLGGSSAISTLTVNVAANSTDIYNGLFGDPRYDFSNTSISYVNDDHNNLGVIFNIGAGGTMMLGGFSDGNSIAGGFVVNGGTLEIYKQADALGQANVTLNNAILAVSNGQYNGNATKPHVILGTGTNSLNSLQGIDSFAGDVQTGTGSDGTLHINGANFIVNTDSTASSIKTLDIDSGRIFLFGNNGLNFIAGNTTVNVNNGAFFDIATGTTATINNQINFSNGSGLVTRNNGSVYTLTDAILPGSGSFTIGTDDTNPAGSSFTISNGQTLTGNLALHIIGNNYLPVTFSGAITGTGNINEDGGGNLFLTGTNTYTGTTAASFSNLYINGDNSGVTGDYYSNFANVTIGHGAKINSNSSFLFGNGGGYGTFILGDANGAVNTTVAGLVMESSGTSYVYNGNTHDTTNSVLTVNNATADTYTGVLGNGTQTNTNGNNLALVKSGAGTLTLTGASTYTGGTTVTGGKLAVDGSIVGNASVGLGAEIGGHGKIGGTLSGAGAVGPGNSPGILTASAVDPSGGTSFNFEFTLAVPDFTNAASSGNDILHLEGGTPFTFALTSANAVNLYFASAGSFEGGFFTNGVLTDNLTANVANATYNYFVADATGAYTYNGNHYDLASGLEATLPALGANFGDGTVDGYTQDFVVTAIATPEPSTYALIGGALLVLVVFVRRRHEV